MAEGRVNENPPEYTPYDEEKSALEPSGQQQLYTAPPYQQQPTYQQSPPLPPPPPVTSANYVMTSQPGAVTVVTTNFGVIVGDFPVQTTCPNCHNTIVTHIKREIGGFCWFIAAMLCLFGKFSVITESVTRINNLKPMRRVRWQRNHGGLCFLCAWIPFVVDSCHDAVHTCPTCNVVIGRYRRF